MLCSWSGSDVDRKLLLRGEVCSGWSECAWTWSVRSEPFSILEHWALARLGLGEQLDGFTE